MASRPSRRYGFFFPIVLIASVSLLPLFLGAYMPSPTATATSVEASSTTITLGDTVTFTATVTATTGTPTGLVVFFDGNTPIGSGLLGVVSGNDQATFSTALLSAAASPHSITAIYQGDATHSGSPSSPISETVNSRTSSTGVVLNPTTVVVGQSSTATVTLTDSGSVPSGTADTFVATGAPATGRTGFTSTLFADGLVLVAGGTDANNTVLKSAEIYSFSNLTFSSTGNLNTARTAPVAVLLPNGKVLIAGGSSDGTASGALNTAELFNPSAGTFSVAGSGSSNIMTAARFGATATLLDNGQVLITGGENSGGVLKSAELYDPATDKFKATGNLNAARTGASATLLGTGKVLIAGGSSDGTANGALNTGELFDSGAGTFTSVAGSNPTLSDNRWQPQAALLLSGKVLIAGGQNNGGALTSADLYDPVADSFTASNQSMSQARANGTAVALPSGMVLLAGGTTSKAVDLYDGDSDVFKTTGSLAQSDSGLVSTLLNNGDVLVVGLTATPASDAELYAPSFNPLGTLTAGTGLTSSEGTDSFGAPCVLVPSNATASTCTSTVTPSNVATSPHTITATYPADAVHSGSSNTASLTVTKADTTTTITGNTPNSSAVNQAVLVSAQVTANSPGSGTPSGNVTVSDGVGQTCTITLISGAGSCSITPVAAGTDMLTATYAGDNNYNGSPSTGVSQTVVAPPSISKAFSPNSIPLNGTSTLTFTITNPAANTVAESGVAFSDALPAGLVVSTPNGLTNSCGGTPSATAGGTSISLIGGGIAVNSSCAVVVNITGAAAGSFTNTSGAVSSTNGGMGNTATDTLTVVAPPSIAKAFSPNSIPLNGTSTLTFTITNPSANTVAESGVAFNDGLPTGLVVATPNGLTDNCGGTPSATAGGTSISLTGGGIPVNSSCTVAVNITGTAGGSFTNTSGAVSSTNGGTGNTASDTLIVVAPPSIAKAFSPTTVVVNQNTTLTFTITNPAANTVAESGVAFGDTLPTGLVVATPNGLTNNCNGTASATAGGTGISLTGGSIPVNSSCTVLMNIIGTASGAYTNTSGAVSSTNGGTGNTPSAPLTVNTRHTTTTVALNPVAVVVDQQSTVTVTVTDDDPNGSKSSPAGTVTVTSDSGGSSSTDVINGSPCTLVASTSGVSTCQVTITPNGKGSGTHTVTASYPGSTVHTASTGSAMLTVTTRHTSTTVALNLSTVVVNQQSTATVTVTDDDLNGGKISPAGMVTVISDSGSSSSADTITGSPCTLAPTVTTGVSTCQVTITPNGKGNGTHTVTASYPGSTVHTASTGSAPLTVNTRHTSTTVALNPNTVVVNQQSTATLTVTDDDPNGGKISPAGMVTVTSDSGAANTADAITGGPCTLVATITTGVSTCQVTVKPNNKGSGTHVITASYAGSDVHSTSTGSANLTVNTRHTSTQVSFSVNTVKIATQLTVTTTVIDDDSNGSPLTPTGSVNISSSVTGTGGDVLGSATCSLNAPASDRNSCTITLTAPHVAGGSHTISASYPVVQGQVHSNSSGNKVLTVQPADTGSTISSTVNLSTFLQTFLGQQVAFTATVTNTDNGSNSAPLGTVQLLVDGSAIQANPVTPVGTTNSGVTFTPTLAQIGLAPNSTVSHSVTVNFQPNADFVLSTSADSISMTMAPAINNIPGQTIPLVALKTNSVGGSGPVNFQCTVQLLGSPIPAKQPANFPLCSLNPSSANLPQTIMVSLTTLSTTASLFSPMPSNRTSPLPGFYALSAPLAAVLALVGIGGSPRRTRWSRRKLFIRLGIMLVLSLLLFAFGCGGGFNNPGNLQPSGNGTQQGTYVVTVIGTDSNNNIVVLSTIPLNVQL